MHTDATPVFLCFILFAATRTLGQSRGDLGSDVKYIDESVQIVNTIFHKYREGVPPRKNYPNPVLLSVNLHVQHVSSLDVVGQTLESTIELEVMWKDSRLSWYPLAVTEITVQHDKVWSPSLSIDNAIEAPKEIDSPKYVIKSNGDIYLYKRLQIKTVCETNFTASSDECQIVIGSNLLNDRIIDFDMNMSSCDVTGSTHELQVSLGSLDKRSQERSWLKQNATFPEFVCQLNVKQTGCCSGNHNSYTGNDNGVEISTLSFTLFVLTKLLMCLL